MEGERLEVLEHDPAVAVHDRLGQARGARGVDHPERMVERHLLELGLALAGGQVLPAREPPGAGGSHRAGRADQVHHDHRGQARQGGHHVVDHLGPGELLASVPVAVAGDEHGRLDLREPVDDAAGAEVGRAGRPDRADAGRGEQADDRLGHVRQQGRDPVAAADAEGAQPPRHPRDLVGELSVGEMSSPGPFGIKNDRRAVGIGPRGPQRVTGVVQRGASEPLHVGHDLADQDRARAAVAEHLEVVPDRRPELPGLRDGPLPQVRVAAELVPAAGQPAHEPGDPGVVDRLLIRLPEHRSVPAAGQVTGVHRHSIVPSGRAWQRPVRRHEPPPLGKSTHITINPRITG